MNVRSRLILVLLLTSAASAFATAWLGYASGRDNLAERIVLQLESLREITADRVRDFFGLKIADATVLASSDEVVGALRELSAAKDSLAGRELPDGVESDLRAWYSRVALRRVATEDVGGTPVVSAYVPDDDWGVYLQYHYLARNADDPAERPELADAGDGSRWSAVHASYHPGLRRTKEALGHYDLFLIDAEGDVVYSVDKEIDFGTNLADGPHADSGLARAWARASAAKAEGFVHFEDFSFYAPSANEPALFVATPVFDAGEPIGVLAMQLGSDRLDEIVNQDGRWEAAGLGESGEISSRAMIGS